MTLSMRWVTRWTRRPGWSSSRPAWIPSILAAAAAEALLFHPLLSLLPPPSRPSPFFLSLRLRAPVPPADSPAPANTPLRTANPTLPLLQGKAGGQSSEVSFMLRFLCLLGIPSSPSTVMLLGTHSQPHLNLLPYILYLVLCLFIPSAWYWRPRDFDSSTTSS